MISLASIQLAITVSQHRSFRRAAAELDLVPSVLSRKVRGLEEELGVSLFRRSTGGVVQTEAGRSFLGRARAVLADLDYAVSQAGVAGCGRAGRLCIGLFLSLASPFLRQLVVRYVADHPDVELEFEEGQPRDHIARVREGQMDIVFVPGRPQIVDCDAYLAFSERGFIALPQHHALASKDELFWSDIRDETLIVRTQQPGPDLHDYVSQRLTDLGNRMRVVRFAVSRENLIHLVGLGLGIALASPSTASIAYPNVVFRPLKGTEELAVSAVWSARNDNPSLRRFLVLLRKMSAERQT